MPQWNQNEHKRKTVANRKIGTTLFASCFEYIKHVHNTQVTRISVHSFVGIFVGWFSSSLLFQVFLFCFFCGQQRRRRRDQWVWLNECWAHRITTTTATIKNFWLDAKLQANGRAPTDKEKSFGAEAIAEVEPPSQLQWYGCAERSFLSLWIRRRGTTIVKVGRVYTCSVHTHTQTHTSLFTFSMAETLRNLYTQHGH